MKRLLNHRIIFPLLAALLLGYLTLCPGLQGWAKTPDIETSRELLYQRYWRGHITFEQMLQQARSLHHQTRDPFMAMLHVREAGYVRQPGETDLPVRTGADPGVPTGRGIFSDEDIECETQACLQQVLYLAKQSHYPVTDTRFHLLILPIDTKVWKQVGQMPALSDMAAYHDFSRGIALDSEYALGAKYGSTQPRAALESVLENITKGQLAFALPPSRWGSGYHRYEELIQMAKNTVRSLEAAGLCTEELSQTCQELNDLRKMRRSPESLGLFRHGISDAALTLALEKQQQRMLDLTQQALQKAERMMTADVKKLYRRIHSPVGMGQDAVANRDTIQMQETLYRIAVRYDVLANRYPALMGRLSGEPSPLCVVYRLMGQIQLLE
jgi:hypothetical protein